VLEEKEPLPLQSLGWEEIDIPAQVGLNCVFIDWGQRRLLSRFERAIVPEQRFRLGPGVLDPTHGGHCLQDPWLVRLEDFSRFLVELDAVSVEGNVAAGHHDAGPTRLQGVVSEGGCGYSSQMVHLQSRILDGSRHGPHDAALFALRTGALVTGDADGVPLLHITDPEEIVQETPRVDVGLQIRDIGH